MDDLTTTPLAELCEEYCNHDWAIASGDLSDDRRKYLVERSERILAEMRRRDTLPVDNRSAGSDGGKA